MSTTLLPPRSRRQHRQHRLGLIGTALATALSAGTLAVVSPAHADETPASTTTTVTTSAGNAVFDIVGSDFDKTYPGIYVSVRESSQGDAAFSGGSTTVAGGTAGTVWLGTGTTGAMGPDTVDAGAAGLIEDDGSFATEIAIDLDAFDPAKRYSIVTRTAHGQGALPANAHQVTETDVTDAVLALKKTTTTTASGSTVEEGQTAPVTVTVKDAATADGTGEVKLYDGATEIGGATLANGTASFTVGNLAVGTHTYTARFLGNDDQWPSSSAPTTVTVNAKTVIEQPPAQTGAAKPVKSITRNGKTLQVLLPAKASVSKLGFLLPKTQLKSKKLAVYSGKTKLGAFTVASNGQIKFKTTKLKKGKKYSLSFKFEAKKKVLVTKKGKPVRKKGKLQYKWVTITYTQKQSVTG